ncbi:hypothetical protein NQZ79_g1540 [Umbelopsis isabellina]|nr:hypothetical protein NQZ79_g1540 [Umbelopsis isabellina]
MGQTTTLIGSIQMFGCCKRGKPSEIADKAIVWDLQLAEIKNVNYFGPLDWTVSIEVDVGRAKLQLLMIQGFMFGWYPVAASMLLTSCLDVKVHSASF